MPSRSRPSRSSRSRTRRRKHHRKHPEIDKNDPEIIWRTDQHRYLRRLEAQLEERYKTVRYTEAELTSLGYKLGAPLDVDDPKPLDLDSRFFVPATPAQVEEALHDYDQGLDGSWSCYPPIVVPRRAACRGQNANRTFESRLKTYYAQRANEADWISGYFRHAASVGEPDNWVWCPNGWLIQMLSRFLYKDEAQRHMERGWRSPSGEPVVQECGWVPWYYAKDFYGTHEPTIPHALGTVWDNMPAKQQQIQKSELRLILGLIKGQLKFPLLWPRHRIFPALVISFQSRFTARIVQGHLENGQIVLRLSRLLDMHTPGLPPDGRIIIQWMRSQPMAETRAALPLEAHRERVNEEHAEDKVGQAHCIAIAGQRDGSSVVPR
ncbi:unnamed protein product [Clonostachys byssicola]|uniref:Uncharacterized protein n=1 Tax=Clonostachys byssicola TaxID=160290 RepID=A0A9N9URC8_9HYPO|nr:unnamed protein product [Clonostachys byssicola]